MEDKFNPDDYIYFALLGERSKVSSYGFTGYTDVNGDYKFISKGKDKDGNDIPKKYKFNAKFRKIRIPNRPGRYQEEIDFLRNHPECVGSPNGRYRKDGEGGQVQLGVYFKEINDDKDATQAIDASKLRIKAMNIALEMQDDPVNLNSMCTVLGLNSKTSNTKFFNLLEFAENNPILFMEAYEAPDREVRALFMRGKAEKVVERKSAVWMLRDNQLGVDDEECVTTLLKNEGLVRMLKRMLGMEIDDVKIETKEEAKDEAPKRQVGRKPKTETKK